MVNPEFFEVVQSTSAKIVLECDWAPRSFGSWAMASSAKGLVTAEMDKVTRISSRCNLGLWPPRSLTFKAQTGSMIAFGKRRTSSEMPAKYLKALMIIALVAPSNGEVLPVMILPSFSSIAAAGPPFSGLFLCKRRCISAPLS
jgi:hypothetical protein